MKYYQVKNEIKELSAYIKALKKHRVEEHRKLSVIPVPCYPYRSSDNDWYKQASVAGYSNVNVINTAKEFRQLHIAMSLLRGKPLLSVENAEVKQTPKWISEFYHFGGLQKIIQNYRQFIYEGLEKILGEDALQHKDMVMNHEAKDVHIVRS